MMLPNKIRESVKSLFKKNFLIVIIGSLKGVNLITALTREPSLNFTSAIVSDSLICLPTCEIILSIKIKVRELNIT